jgi:glutamate synthase (NADPH/NADH) small chain
MQEVTGQPKLTFRRFKEGDNAPGELREKIFKADKSYKCPTYVHRTPPCQASCPSGHDIRGWLAIARGMDKPADAGTPWQQYAFERMTSTNPFPSVMGRVCPAPCEAGCNRNEVDDFVGINAVEHYVGDWAIQNNVSFSAPAASTGKKVAVIGGGPAGLSAAFFLRSEGHGVTIFEAHGELGGMMRYGIPGYRTPRDKLDAEIKRILDMGVETRMNCKVGQDVTIEQLEAEYDAIFWALGAQKGRPLPVPGFDAENCLSGIEFLDAFNQGWVFSTAKRVLVVGGGDTSIDVASVARRLGHITKAHEPERIDYSLLGYAAHDAASAARREGVEATLTSLFPIEQMTAAAREREDALREGVTIMGGVMPLEVLKGPDGRARGLRMCKCTMNGMTPIPTPDTEFELEADIIISAIGQAGDLQGLEPLDNGRGFIATDRTFKVKGRDKHFAGGDIIRPHLLTTAVGHGRVAADVINSFLAGHPQDRRPKIDAHTFNLIDELAQRHLEPAPYGHEQVSGTSSAKWAVHNYEDRSSSQVIPHDELFLGHFGYAPRSQREEVHVESVDVMGNFAERIVPLTEAQAQAEGKRCMSCGLCFECDNCVIFCPQTAVQKAPKAERAVGRYVYTDYTKCVGCHICADVCPTGYIEMGLGE